jgi:hypothetical protein
MDLLNSKLKKKLKRLLPFSTKNPSILVKSMLNWPNLATKPKLPKNDNLIWKEVVDVVEAEEEEEDVEVMVVEIEVIEEEIILAHPAITITN